MQRAAGKQSPYPRRGTPAGDQVVGDCQAMGCSKILQRGDHFVCLVGDVLVCRACHENPAAKLKKPAHEPATQHTEAAWGRCILPTQDEGATAR